MQAVLSIPDEMFCYVGLFWPGYYENCTRGCTHCTVLFRPLPKSPPSKPCRCDSDTSHESKTLNKSEVEMPPDRYTVYTWPSWQHTKSQHPDFPYICRPLWGYQACSILWLCLLPFLPWTWYMKPTWHRGSEASYWKYKLQLRMHFCHEADGFRKHVWNLAITESLPEQNMVAGRSHWCTKKHLHSI